MIFLLFRVFFSSTKNWTYENVGKDHFPNITNKQFNFFHKDLYILQGTAELMPLAIREFNIFNFCTSLEEISTEGKD